MGSGKPLFPVAPKKPPEVNGGSPGTKGRKNQSQPSRKLSMSWQTTSGASTMMK